jgi:hypothetical protein
MVRIINGWRVMRVRAGLWTVEGRGFATTWAEVCALTAINA